MIIVKGDGLEALSLFLTRGLYHFRVKRLYAGMRTRPRLRPAGIIVYSFPLIGEGRACIDYKSSEMRMKKPLMKKWLKRVLTVALFLAAALVYFAADSGRVPDARATGGAFPFTKHGGGTVDGIKFSGINRAVAGEAGAFYYDQSEAGRYQSGECMHCHEPHSSFGGAEPPPTGSSGQPYLLMQNPNKNLCLYCHDNINYSMFYGTGVGYWEFFQGRTRYDDSSHGQSSSFRWPGVSGSLSGTEAFPRDFARPIDNLNDCINCHTPHGLRGDFDGGTAPAAGNYTVTSLALTGNVERQTIAREEALCLNCHDSGGPAYANIKGEVDKYFLTAGSGHPVRKNAYFGRHSLSGTDDDAMTVSNNEVGWQVQSGWFIAASAHSECTDCHNPHVARGRGTGMPPPWEGTVMQWSQGSNNPAGIFNPNRYDTPANSSSSPVKLASVNIGVWGVGVNTATGAIADGDRIRALETSSDRAYNLCFKCHSAWAWGAATGTASAIIAPSTDSTLAKSWASTLLPSNYYLTDVPAEFATNNMAYHPVFASGKNRPELNTTPVRNPNWCGNAGSGYTANDTCGPADGARQDLVNLTEVVGGVSIQLEQTLSQAFVPPWRHTSRITCVDCHEDSSETTPRGPHGSERPFILRKVDPTISYTVCNGSSATVTANCPATTPINYGSYAGLIGTGVNSTIFCFNCHRADVYTFGDFNGTNGIDRSDFSRVPHPMHNTNNSGTLNGDYPGAGPPRGISCMGCHGGGGGRTSPGACTTATCKLGNIHGSNYATDQRAGAISNRLISPGSNWYSWQRATTAANVNCTRGGGVTNWTGCTANYNDGNGNNLTARYTYP